MVDPCPANTYAFTDNPADSSDEIEDDHIDELRAAINLENTRRGLGAIGCGDATAGDTILDDEWDDMYTGIDTIDDNPGGSCSHSNLSWSYNPKNAGDAILVATINELRDNIDSLSTECICDCNWSCPCNCNWSCPCNCNWTCPCNCNYSDEELKENIVPITDALDIISDIKGVMFDWKDDSFGGGKNLGVLAQDIEKVLPELVVEREHGKAVYYQQLIPVLIEAIKELQNKVKKLEEM